MVTYWCKACRKLETQEKPINVFSATRVSVDGVEYLAIYAHTPEKPEEIPGRAAIQWVRPPPGVTPSKW